MFYTAYPEETIIAKSPAKIIIFGEHSVLYGSKCVSMAIKKYGRVRIVPGNGKIICKDVKGRVSVLNDLVKFRFVGHDVIIDLDITMGCSLGSSAINCLMISAIISVDDNDPSFRREEMYEGESVIRRRAVNLEHIFHGRSSGADVIASYFGGMVFYQSKLIKKMDTSNIFKYKLIMWNSGVFKFTSDAFKGKTMKHKKLSDLVEKAYSVITQPFTLREFYCSVRECQDCLEEIVDVPYIMKKEIERLRVFGIESKVTGSGNGGHLITLVNKDDHIEGWDEAKIDYEGFIFNY